MCVLLIVQHCTSLVCQIQHGRRLRSGLNKKLQEIVLYQIAMKKCWDNVDIISVIMSDETSDNIMTNTRPPDADHADLTSEEEAATKKFLENVNKWRAARKLEEVNNLEN